MRRRILKVGFLAIVSGIVQVILLAPAYAFPIYDPQVFASGSPMKIFDYFFGLSVSFGLACFLFFIALITVNRS